jgi:hypothetical protein
VGADDGLGAKQQVIPQKKHKHVAGLSQGVLQTQAKERSGAILRSLNFSCEAAYLANVVPLQVVGGIGRRGGCRIPCHGMGAARAHSRLIFSMNIKYFSVSERFRPALSSKVRTAMAS